MARRAPVTTVIELPTGVSVQSVAKLNVDWPSVRMMVESGVPIDEVAGLFKIHSGTIHAHCRAERWMTPSRVNKLRKELSSRQREVFDQTGATKSVLELKASIWEERSERWKERMAEIVDKALDGIDPEVNGAMIGEAKDFKAIMEIARILTGEAQVEDNAPKLAVNIGFLRGNNAPKPIEAEIIES